MNVPKSKQIFFFTGSSESLLTEKTKEITQNFPDHDLETIDGASYVLEQFVVSLQTPPLFTTHKIIWIKNLKMLEKTPTKDEGGLFEILKNSLPDQNIVILTHTKADQRIKFVSELKKIAHFEEIELGEEWFFRKAQELAKKYQKKISRNVSKFLMNSVGDDSDKFLTELEKIATFVGPRKEVIEIQDVLAIGTFSKEEPFYRFVDDLMSKKYSEALLMLRQLMFQGENGIALATSVLNTLRLLIQVRDLQELGYLDKRKIPRYYQKTFISDLLEILPKELLETFPKDASFLKQHPFRSFNLLKQSLSFSMEELKDIFLKTSRTYWELVSSRPANITLEKLVIETIL